MKPLFVAIVFALPALAAQPTNLLSKAQLRRGDNVQNPARMIDGIAPVEGEVWNSDFSGIVGPEGVAEWDLGASTHVEGALIQGDNNDTYVLTGSEDGVTFTPVWRAGSVEGAGMRIRSTAELNTNLRYLRLTAEGGDKMYSVGEIVLLGAASDVKSYDIARKDKPRDPPPGLNTSWLVVGAVVILLILFLRKKAPPVEAAAAPVEVAKTEEPVVEEPKSDEPKR